MKKKFFFLYLCVVLFLVLFVGVTFHKTSSQGPGLNPGSFTTLRSRGSDPIGPCINGAIYFNTSAQKIRACQVGVWVDVNMNSVLAGLKLNYNTYSSAHTLNTSEGVAGCSGATTITIPHATIGQVWIVFNNGSNTCTLSPDSGNITLNATIAATASLNAGQGVSVFCDGSNCFAFGIGGSSGTAGTPLLNTGISRWILPIRSGALSSLGENTSTYITGGGSIGDGAATATNTTFADFFTSSAFTASCATGCVGGNGAGLYAAGVSGTVYQLQLQWPTNISTNTGRYWAALATNSVSVIAATDTPGTATLSGIGIRFSSIAGDTHPVCVSFNGSTQTIVTPSPAITPTNLMKIEFDDNGSSWTVKVNGTSVCSLSSTLPASGTLMLMVHSATANSANRIDDEFFGFQETGQ